jgi:alpha-beta hydrolase superfamily lysophospholipase/ubiquinone/menaquinone biosynthesis C-methylase UbiE
MIATSFGRRTRIAQRPSPPASDSAAPERARPRFLTSEHWFESGDGTRLFYRAWRPSAPAGKLLILFHRGHEHSGRWEDVVDRLAPEGFTVFAWDARGNGRSEGPRDDAANAGCYARDAELFVGYLSETEGVAIDQIAVVGHSVGAAVLAAWIHDYAPRIRAAVLATPAFRIRLYLPLAIPSLRLAQKLGILRYVPSYVKARVLTHDPAQRTRHEQDALISHAISTRILLDLHDTAARIIQDAAAIRVPSLVLTAGADWVVDTAAQTKFFERLGAPVKQLEVLPGYYHDIYHEANAAHPLRLTRAFIEAAFAGPADAPPLLDAHERGYTFEEYRALSQPLRPLSRKWVSYQCFRLFLRTLGRWSHGIRLGQESGFNSGRTLDYVYRNRPGGFTALGRLIDRNYLAGAGWRGIRWRRQLLEGIVQKAIEETHARKQSVHLLDVAAGAGRYLLETMKRCASLDVSAELRDVERKNLEEAKTIADSLGLERVQFVQANAFAPAPDDGTAPRTDIAIVSGLYELFADNTRVMSSLRSIARAVPPGGTLIYTNQPWHPQLELIARGLSDWDGKPWVMRRRTQAEMDDLVRAAGFEKTQMEIDPWGMFTVSLARRVA